MSQELGDTRCGLDVGSSHLRISSGKHFGPENFKTNTVELHCATTGCPLFSGVEVRFPTIAGSSIEDVTSIFEQEAITPDSTISNRLQSLRVSQCPAYRQQFNSDQNS